MVKHIVIYILTSNLHSIDVITNLSSVHMLRSNLYIVTANQLKRPNIYKRSCL